jgi:hypothetical protein
VLPVTQVLEVLVVVALEEQLTELTTVMAALLVAV